MVFSVIAGDTQIVILTHGAVPAGLHVVLALIAGIDEAVLALGVELHQHAHS